MTRAGLAIALTHRYAWPEVRRGAERYVHELGAALVWHGHDVRILTTAGTANSSPVLGVPVRRFAAGPLVRHRGGESPGVEYGVRCLAALMPRRLDVWHANSLYDGAAATLASRIRPGLRSVVTAHGPLAPLTAAGRPRREAYRLFRAADRLVCVSSAAAREAVVGDAELRQPLVIPPGVDSDVFSPGPGRSDRPVVLYVGALDVRRKNLDLLLAAAAEVDGVEIWLAGTGDPGPMLAAAPPGVRGRVRLLGALDGADLVAAYRSAWVTALISEREVFGMAVVESLACGTPALVLADGWGPEGVVTAATGIASARGALVDGLRRALALSEVASTRDACRATAEQYDWRRKVAPRLLEVYAA